MARNLEAEFDSLQNEVAELRELIKEQSKRPKLPERDELVSGEYGKWFDTLKILTNDTKSFCQSNNHIGALTTVGYFDAGTHVGGEHSEWYHFLMNADNLLSLIENRTAEKVLSCIGNNDRLNLLLALLKKPNTVASLVEECGYTSPGQVYHHLRPLIAADLVAEDKKHTVKGTYIVPSHRVPGIITLLGGIAIMADTRYTQGNWDEANEEC